MLKIKLKAKKIYEVKLFIGLLGLGKILKGVR